MDSYQEMDRFGVENDYEDGQWIGGEFYYRRKRKEAPVQTKDDVLYGVFAGDSSDEDNGGSKSKRWKKERDLTKPVNFVSTGTVVPNEEEEREKEKEMDDSPINTPGLGNSNANSNSMEVDEDEFLRTGLGKKIKEGLQRRYNDREREKEEKLKRGRSETRGGQMGGIGIGIGSGRGGGGADLGGFEKHTKGIGMKMLQKMGYKGGGLGKNAQGIVAPIEAKLRPKNMGMGFNDYKETAATKLEDVLAPAATTSATATTTSVSKKSDLSWKKNRNKKTGKQHLSAKDLLAKKQEEEEEEGLAAYVGKVIDMRGPQVRILTNLENLNDQETSSPGADDDAFTPELLHNIKLIVDSVESDVIKIDRDLRSERETAISLKNEKERLEAEAYRQKQQLDSLEGITTVLDRLEQESTMGTLTLDSLIKDFSDLQERYANDYKLCNLSCIACSFAMPLFRTMFRSWDPLGNPFHAKDMVSSWKALLQWGEGGNYSMSSPYTQLVSEVMVPAVNMAGVNTWQAKDPETMLRFLESWEKLLPPCVLDAILDMVVLPKLKSAVDLWEPLQDKVPIHLWVHPWLPLLGHKLEDLYPTIRFKLCNVLGAWHPSDQSAYIILSPWKDVFDTASWEQLMHSFIVPKLQLVLQEFQVYTANQRIDQFNWVMSWASAIPVHLMVALLGRFFFPKWINALELWLLSNPSHAEVESWFMLWMERFPDELLANEIIRSQFDCGLEMMGRAIKGLPVVQPGLKESVSYARMVEQRQFEAQQKTTAAATQRQFEVQQKTAAPQAASLKDIIEYLAQQHGLVFKPKPGRMHDGHQIHGFGNVNIIVDSFNQRVYAQTEGTWSSVDSLEWLLDLHKRKIGRY